MQRYLALFLLLLLTACGTTTNPPKPPSTAQAHIGQVLTASSSLAQGRSLIQHARIILEHMRRINSEVIARTDLQDFSGAKSRLIDVENIRVLRRQYTIANQPGLSETIEKALFHTRQASRTLDASETIRRQTPEIWRKANRILEDTDLLAAQVTRGLEATSLASLRQIADDINTLVLQISGKQPAPGGYSFDDLERDLQLMLASNNEQLSDTDRWFLKNFTATVGTDDWAFPKNSSAVQQLPQ